MARALLPAVMAMVFAVLILSGAPMPADATSIGSPPPHDARLGCAAMQRLIDNLNAGRTKDEDALLGPSFYTDALGRVERSEEAVFLHAMRHNEGREDARPARLYRVNLVHADRIQPIYLVTIEREVWRETRFEEDEMLMTREVRDPRHYWATSSWLATFLSNDIRSFREAAEFYPLAVESTALHCPS